MVAKKVKIILTFLAAEDERRGIFEGNVALIRAANDRYDRGLTSYELGVNCFGDVRYDTGRDAPSDEDKHFRFEEFVTENLGLGVLGGTAAIIVMTRIFHLHLVTWQ